MPSPSKFLDTSGLTLYDQNIKDYIDDIIENDISPVIDAKAADTVFGPSGTGHSKGLVPDPGSTQGSTKFLREDSSWAVPALDPSSMTTVTGTVTLSGTAQANWTQTDSSADDYIKNKPSLATVATSGSYADLSNKPSLATVATSGSYNDLTNKPTIPSVSTATSIADGVTGYTTGDQVYDYAENKANKSTSISSSSTDTQYPSALAVKSYVEGYSNGRIYYGTCTTAKATKAKVATLVDGTGFSLAAGVIVAIKFTYASTSATMTLSVDNSTAASIMQYGTTASSSGTTTSGWPAGATVIFIYDGTNWLRSFFSNTTYSAMTQAEIDAGTSTTGRTIAPSMLVANVEMLANKVTSLSSSSTDTEYPSALAVKTYVDNNGFNPSLMAVGSGTPVITSMSQADWNQNNSSAGDYIKNKPIVPTAAQVVAAGESGYVTGDMLYNILGDLETFLANC